jgi:predicted transcriptional regulator
VLNIINECNSSFKFVCETIEDLEEVENIVTDYNLDRNKVIISPLGTNAENNIETLQSLANEAIKRGFRMLPRLHIDLKIK